MSFKKFSSVIQFVYCYFLGQLLILLQFFSYNQKKMEHEDQKQIVHRNSITEDDFPSIHSCMIVFAWLTIGNLGLWIMAFRHWKYSKYIHMTALTIITILNLMTGFLALLIWGIPNKMGNLHTGIGLTTIILFTLECVCGVVTLIVQKRSDFNAHKVIIWNNIHTILGKLLYLLMMVPILVPSRYTKPQFFISTLVVCLFSYISYLIFNKFRSRIQSLDLQTLAQQKPEGISLGKLLHLDNNYFLFSDYVYPINELLTRHPGGAALIQDIRGREVDKFLYGTEPPQTTDISKLQNLNFIKSGKMMIHHHTIDSIKLAGKPIFKLQIKNPYANMDQTNAVEAIFQNKPDGNNSMYLVYLDAKNADKKFIYEGYSQLSQLGRYFTLTIDNKISRLYTMANFLHRKNLQFYRKMQQQQMKSKNKQNQYCIELGVQKQISSENRLQQQHEQQYQYKQCKQTGSGNKIANPIESTKIIINHIRQQINYNQNQKQHSVPLLIKKVQKGEFTSKLFQQSQDKKQIKISSPKGIGLHLTNVDNGQIIIFAGGTGINCFYDTFDLLFKQMAIKQKLYSKKLIKDIQERDPILKNTDLFIGKYKFTLFYSVRNQNQIIQQFAYLLNKLSTQNSSNSSNNHQNRQKLLKVCLRISDNQLSQQFKSKYPNLKVIKTRFDAYYKQIQERRDQIKQIYICGPHSLTHGVYKDLIEQNFKRSQYTFM